MISKLIPGGEIRIVRKGDKSDFNDKKAMKDYIMIKTVSRKNPFFLDKEILKIIKEMQSDEDVKALIREWG